MKKLSNVEVYMLTKNKAMIIDLIKYPNLWDMVQKMSVKYYNKSFS